MVKKVEKRPAYIARTISLAAIFTAIVFMLTYMFALYAPATLGFFNIGEIGVYLSALIGGPIVGAIAGGLGSAFADIALGFPYYAPGTLVIKGIEGFIAGFLYKKLRKAKLITRFYPWIAIALVLGIFASLSYPHGISFEIRPGESPVIIRLPFIAVLAIVLSIIIICLLLLLIGNDKTIMAFSCIVAGIEMVLGYFLYEAFILGFGLVALTEVPINLLQMTVGTVVAVPTVIALKEAGAIAES